MTAKTVMPPVDTTKSASITSVTPIKALASSQVTIYGSKFNTAFASNTVTVNGITATIDSVNATEIVFTLPANATSGAIKLTTGSTTLTYSTSFTVITPGTLSTYANFYLEHIAIDAVGNIYGDKGEDTVYKVTPSGAVSTLAVLANTASFGQLWGTAIDASGNVYEAGHNTHVIYKITPAGVVSILAGSGNITHADGKGSVAGFQYPFGLAIDAKGNLYTNDDGYVRKITPDGTVITIAGTGVNGHADGPASTATFGALEGIAIDAKGNIFVSDNEYFNIRKISTSGVVSTFAGSGASGIVDGNGTAAEFALPQAMAIDAGGNIFVSDTQYNSISLYTVRKITPDGTVSTFLKGSGAVVVGPYASATTSFPDGITFDAAGSMYICNTIRISPTVRQSVTKLTFQ